MPSNSDYIIIVKGPNDDGVFATPTPLIGALYLGANPTINPKGEQALW
jgi:hypothetical protein